MINGHIDCDIDDPAALKFERTKVYQTCISKSRGLSTKVDIIFISLDYLDPRSFGFAQDDRIGSRTLDFYEKPKGSSYSTVRDI
ncbi:hypothetical protein C4544_03125 [candidate division WS5 bacterium]|uniref:Uncharacterized protein n=1 Tax=candidate division WS5 bacterium TaxID=2093353 RepID=A0A419DEG8_9BACT|nr:MAG: hypothetical protein C4544_03125 [candidate division WS5 bacterium]